MGDKFPNYFNELVLKFVSWLDEAEQERLSSTVLHEACSYSLLAGGKRFRPALLLASADMLGIARERLRPLALAIEFIHTLSLIHDDLPCMDDDTLRRGKPTLHVKYDEATALLAGDLLFGRAFYQIAHSDLPAEVSRKAVELLGLAIIDLCDGQMMDLSASVEETPDSTDSASDRKRAAEELLSRHLKKTAALISLSVRLPSLFLTEAEDKEISLKLEEYGRSLGLLFQITDDIIEVTSDTQVLGKNADSDTRGGTPTYVSIFGLDGARQRADEAAANARQALSSFGEKADFLLWLVDYLLEREK